MAKLLLVGIKYDSIGPFAVRKKKFCTGHSFALSIFIICMIWLSADIGVMECQESKMVCSKYSDEMTQNSHCKNAFSIVAVMCGLRHLEIFHSSSKFQVPKCKS